MTVYVIAQLDFSDEASYRRYQAAFPAVFAASGGSVLVADESPQCLEGDTLPDKIVVMAFDDEAQARSFLFSEEYEEISADRRAGAQTVSFMVQGLAGP